MVKQMNASEDRVAETGLSAYYEKHGIQTEGQVWKVLRRTKTNTIEVVEHNNILDAMHTIQHNGHAPSKRRGDIKVTPLDEYNTKDSLKPITLNALRRLAGHAEDELPSWRPCVFCPMDDVPEGTEPGPWPELCHECTEAGDVQVS